MEAVESYRERAPRLRLAALVVVAVLVAALIAFAVLAPDQTVTGTTLPSGQMCVVLEHRVWTSVDTVVASDVAAVSLEGRWTSTGEGTAQLTTPGGQVIEMRTDPQDPEISGGAIACGIR